MLSNVSTVDRTVTFVSVSGLTQPHLVTFYRGDGDGCVIRPKQSPCILHMPPIYRGRDPLRTTKSSQTSLVSPAN